MLVRSRLPAPSPQAKGGRRPRAPSKAQSARAANRLRSRAQGFIVLAMDATEQLIRSEVAIGYALLWRACLHDGDGKQEFFRMRAAAAWDSANDALQRCWRRDAELVKGLMEFQNALATWSADRAELYRATSSEWNATARR